MDEFDQFNQTTQGTEILDETNSNQQDEDLFGPDLTTNTTVAPSSNVFDEAPVRQQPDLCWMIDDNLTETKPKRNFYDVDDDDALESLPSTSQIIPSGEDFVSNPSTTQDFQLYPTSDLSPDANELSYDDSNRRPSENSLSYDMFSNAVSSASAPSAATSITSANPFNATDSISALHAFNARRQQEIAEMETIEKQKIEELRQQGKKELERWYEDRRTRMEQKRQSMRQEQDDSFTQALEKSHKETCDWSKVIRLLDFSQGTQITKQKRDITRMRAAIIQAKRDREGRKSENGV